MVPTGTSERAIPHLPPGASRLNYFSDTFKCQVMTHPYSWYKFANSKLRCSVPNGSLYLITEPIRLALARDLGPRRSTMSLKTTWMPSTRMTLFSGTMRQTIRISVSSRLFLRGYRIMLNCTSMALGGSLQARGFFPSWMLVLRMSLL